jgi:hypothetical protein
MTTAARRHAYTDPAAGAIDQWCSIGTAVPAVVGLTTLAFVTTMNQPRRAREFSCRRYPIRRA